MKNECRITKKEMLSWGKDYSLHGLANVLLFVFWCVVLVGGTVGLVSSICLHQRWVYVYVFAIIVYIGVFKLFLQRFLVWARRYKVYATTYGVSEWIRTTEFSEEEIVITDHTSVSKLRYENITGMTEKKNVVMIFFNHNIGLRLYKDGFVEGTWEACKAMISQKTKT